MEQIRRIMRPTDVPDQGLLCDLLWSDPDKVSSLYKKQVIYEQTIVLIRYLYRPYVVEKLEYICTMRSHGLILPLMMCVSVRLQHDER